jgi:hypothetical protein
MVKIIQYDLGGIIINIKMYTGVLIAYLFRCVYKHPLVSSSLSVRMKYLGSNGMNSHDNFYWGVPLTSVNVIQFWLTDVLCEDPNVFFVDILVCLYSVDGSTLGFLLE